MRVMLGLALVAVVAIAIGACGTFGATDDSARDAAASDDAASEAGNALDATTSADQSNGETDADAATPACDARTPSFDNFERTNLVGGGPWTGMNQKNGATLTIERTSDLLVGLGTLKADVAPTTTGTARLELALAPSSCPVRTAFVFRAKTLPTGSSGASTIVSVRYATGEAELRMLTNGALELYEDGPASQHPSLNWSLSTSPLFITVIADSAKKTFAWEIKDQSTQTVLSKDSRPLVNALGVANAVWIGAEDAASVNQLVYFIDDVTIE